MIVCDVHNWEAGSQTVVGRRDKQSICVSMEDADAESCIFVSRPGVQ